ncbi:MAG: response regulator [Leptolyngbya sp. SIO1E4]|nr:response regulator [Leptolyngbya sp. SIO1E4]
MMPEQQQRILGYFIEEAKDHLNTIEQGLLNLQATIEDPEMVNEVFRAAHSVKGGAAMLDIGSIQRTSHRLEDYFKILKESPAKVDRALESMFLQVFDGLQALLEELQGPFGLTEDKAQEVMNDLEPVFEQLEQHLHALVAESAVAKSASPAPAATESAAPQRRARTAPQASEESALKLVFRSDVPGHLREMLALFKQSDTEASRAALQSCCDALARIGEQFDLYRWCDLASAARQAVGNLEQTYRALAPVVIKDLKRSQEQVLAGKADDISISVDLEGLMPPVAEPEPMGSDIDALLDDALSVSEETEDTDLVDLFGSDSQPAPPEADLDWLESSTSSTRDAAAIESEDFAAEEFFPEASSGSEPLAATPDQEPSVGASELNSLADLFEGEIASVESPWQEVSEGEDAIAASSGPDIDISDDFSDLLGNSLDDDPATEIQQDLADLFGEATVAEDLPEPEDPLAASVEISEEISDSIENDFTNLEDPLTTSTETSDISPEEDFSDLFEATEISDTEAASQELDLSSDDDQELDALLNATSSLDVDDLDEAVSILGDDTSSAPSMDAAFDDLGDLFEDGSDADLVSDLGDTTLVAGAETEVGLDLSESGLPEPTSDSADGDDILSDPWGDAEEFSSSSEVTTSADPVLSFENIDDPWATQESEEEASDDTALDALDELWSESEAAHQELEDEPAAAIEDEDFADFAALDLDDESNPVDAEDNLGELPDAATGDVGDLSILFDENLDIPSSSAAEIIGAEASDLPNDLEEEASDLDALLDSNNLDADLDGPSDDLLDDLGEETSDLDGNNLDADLDSSSDDLLDDLEGETSDLDAILDGNNLDADLDSSSDGTLDLDSELSDLLADEGSAISQTTDSVISDENALAEEILFSEESTSDAALALDISDDSLLTDGDDLQDLLDTSPESMILGSAEAAASALDSGAHDLDLSLGEEGDDAATTFDAPETEFDALIDDVAETEAESPASADEVWLGAEPQPLVNSPESSALDLDLALENAVVNPIDYATEDTSLDDLLDVPSVGTQARTPEMSSMQDDINDFFGNPSPLPETSGSPEFDEVLGATSSDFDLTSNADSEPDLDDAAFNALESEVESPPDDAVSQGEMTEIFDDSLLALETDGVSDDPVTAAANTTFETGDAFPAQEAGSDELEAAAPLDGLDAFLEHDSTSESAADLDALLETDSLETSEAAPPLEDLDVLLDNAPTDTPADNLDALLTDDLLEESEATDSPEDLDVLLEGEPVETSEAAPPLEDLDVLLEAESIEASEAAPPLEDLDALLDDAPADTPPGNLDALLTDDLSEEPEATDSLEDLDALLDAESGEASETVPLEDVEDLDALLGAESASEEPEATGSLEDLDALLEEAPADAAPLLEDAAPPLEDLDALLDSESDSADSNADFGELDALLEDDPSEAASHGDVDFDDLEALLDDDAPPLAVSVPDEEDQDDGEDEFGDLEKLLEEADQTLGGSSPTIRSTSGSRSRSSRRVGAMVDQTMRVSVKHLDTLNNLVGELVVNRNSLEQDQERLRQFLDNLLFQVQQLNDVGQRMRDLYERSLLESSLISNRQAFQGTRVRGGESRSGNGGNDHATGATFDALEMDRFTGFHTLSQEMIELIVRVRESASDIAYTVESSDQITRQFRQVTTQLQEGLNKARMVPFAQTADRLPRAVRDISLKCGKEARLVVEGRDTLIDKMILERLYDPMTHLVNNAITHGIETPDERAAVGKPREGTITVRAFYQGNQTVIYIADDGAGINPDVVKRKAIKKGLITQAEANAMTMIETYELLFRPGFTTREKADDFAGRGFGMDVVRTALSEIRGSITIDSEMSKGTSFTIRLPLTLSISKALSCLNNQARIAFPMDGVEDMFDVPRDRIHTDENNQNSIPWRDTTLTFQSLSELLQFNRSLGRGRVYGGNKDDDMVSIVVLRSANTFIGLQVDRVLGEQEIVIKQLEGPVPKPMGIAGATVLGDGRVMPIADVLELIDIAQGRVRREAGSSLWTKTEEPPTEDVADTKTEPTVLIVDDSITVRELLSMSFNKVGYRVEQARDGQEAWEKLRSGLPCELVFCDIEMPRMDGLELLSRMQKDSILKRIPIAMLTSRGADRHRQMALDLGASGYFTKPYLEEALLDAAQRMLNGEVLLTKAEGED